MKFKNLKELMAKFTDETVCREYMEKIYFPDGKPVCPYCQFKEKIYRIEGGKRYKCKQCQKKFSITVGTIYENSNIPMSTWFGAMYLITSHKKGISSIQLGKDLGVTQKTAWFMLHRIREMLREKSPKRMINIVEVDETYVGGKEINKHASKKNYAEGQKRLNDKAPIVGMVDREEGHVIVQHVENASHDVIEYLVTKNVSQEATLVSDQSRAYDRMHKFYEHLRVDHSAKQYVNGMAHTNTIEGFWSQLKRGLDGIYHQVSVKHLGAYAQEFAFRYNTRKMSEATRFDLSMAQSVGVRLKYKELTK